MQPLLSTRDTLAIGIYIQRAIRRGIKSHLILDRGELGAYITVLGRLQRTIGGGIPIAPLHEHIVLIRDGGRCQPGIARVPVIGRTAFQLDTSVTAGRYQHRIDRYDASQLDKRIFHRIQRAARLIYQPIFR